MRPFRTSGQGANNDNIMQIGAGRPSSVLAASSRLARAARLLVLLVAVVIAAAGPSIGTRHFQAQADASDGRVGLGYFLIP